ncbi:DMT family transporter, partial [Bilophila wadsworthia]|uniref:DMT family transporter n=3 Tax=Bilophila wadsworthia TaxID=35833 RepID=UPI0032C09B7D
QGLFLEGGEAGAEEGSFRLLAEKDTVELAMEKIFYLGMMIAAGLLFGLQSPINAQLSRSVGVLEGSFLSFLGGTLVLGLAMLVFGKGHVGGVFGVPAWQLVGGLLGATVVFNTILCVPHIGVLPTLMAMILGNLIMGCIIDHFGWFGIPVTLFTWRRFLGVLLVLLGLLIAFKR